MVHQSNWWSNGSTPCLCNANKRVWAGVFTSHIMYWLMYWLLCMVLMDTAYTPEPCHAACHEIAHVLSACHPSTMQLDRSMHSFEVLHLMRGMDSQALHGWSTDNSKGCLMLIGVW